jgi:hypothetical protein
MVKQMKTLIIPLSLSLSLSLFTLFFRLSVDCGGSRFSLVSSVSLSNVTDNRFLITEHGGVSGGGVGGKCTEDRN